MDKIQTGSFEKGHWYASKSVIGVGVACLAVAASILIILLSVVSKPSVTASDICTRGINVKLMSQASIAIEDQDATTLTQVGNKVKSLPDYLGDANCMYVLFKKNLLTGNIAQSQSDLGYIEKFPPKHNFYASFGNLTIADLKAQFSAAKQAEDTAANHAVQITNPTVK